MKHIIVIIDGTWVSAADRDHGFSNAYCLNWMLDNRANDDAEQVVFYSSGIGTDRSTSQLLSGMTARGIDFQTREAYINICSNFKASDSAGRPDRLYLFGFSRGAIVARALAGLISSCGILRPAKMDYFPDIWKRFVDKRPAAASRARRVVHRDVDIEMVGLFDCVFGSRNRRNTFHTLTFRDFKVAERVKAAVQLLSLDDSRPAFKPMLWERNDSGGVLEQIWMPGVHSDVGGTYPNRALGNLALLTMIDRIHAHTALKFDDESVRGYRRAVTRCEVHNDRAGIWRVRRRPAKFRNYVPDNDQYLHPVVDVLTEEDEIRYKGRWQKYQLDSSFQDEPPCPFFDDFHDHDQDWVACLGL